MRPAARALILTAVAASVSFAATTATWELNGYQDFLRGRMSGLSITRDGHLILGPKLETVFSSDQAQIWSIATAPDGSLYLGTGNRGRLLKIDAGRQWNSGMDFRSARDLRGRSRPRGRCLRRHLARRQGVPHRERPRH